MDNRSIKENIVKLRTGRKLSQEDAADRMSISRNSYRNLEKGKTKIISEQLPKLAETLGCTQEEILLGYEPDRSGEGELHEGDGMVAQMRAITENYEKRIAELQSELEKEKQLTASLADTVAALKEIIRMLQKE